MKVFINKRYGNWSNGLAIVAANNAEEANEVMMDQLDKEYGSDKVYYMNMIDKNGEVCLDEESCVEMIHPYYRKENWVELTQVTSNYENPTFIDEDGSTE